MKKITATIRKIKYALRHDFFSIENIVLIAAIILCLTWTFQSIAAMSRNWELSERLTTEKKQLELVKVEVEAAELENEYFKTEEYQELASRRNLDKKLPGESMVVMPDNSDNAKNLHKLSTQSEEPKNNSNFDQWLKFLFPNY